MRTRTITQKVATPFSALYLHIEYDDNGKATSGSISSPGKDPDSTVAQMVQALSDGLAAALRP